MLFVLSILVAMYFMLQGPFGCIGPFSQCSSCVRVLNTIRIFSCFFILFSFIRLLFPIRKIPSVWVTTIETDSLVF